MWLSTIHEDKILDLLRRDLLFQGSSAEIANMAFFEKLREAYNCRDTGEYDESRAFTWIRGIGKALVAGERHGLETMVNISGNHWVAITLDFKQSLVWYGDLFGRKLVEEVTSVLNWWSFHHTGCQIAYRNMKISAQIDGFSCGLLGTNALAHFHLPEGFNEVDDSEIEEDDSELSKCHRT